MKLLKHLILICLIGFGGVTTQAQVIPYSQKFEFGIWAGGANYIGDITPSLTNYHRAFQPALGVYTRINLNTRLAWKTQVGAGRIRAQDAWSNNAFAQARNLSFRSNIFELTTQIEFNFFDFILDHPKYYFTPYVFLGIGVFRHNPQAFFNNEWVDLQPLGTEGQQFPDYSGREPYSLFQICVPYGGGFKYSVSKGLTIGLEIGYRATYTDYLDDISTEYIDQGVLAAGVNGGLAADLADRSLEVRDEPIGVEGRQRGNDRHTDAYMFTGISIAYTIRKHKCPSPSKVF